MIEIMHQLVAKRRGRNPYVKVFDKKLGKIACTKPNKAKSMVRLALATFLLATVSAALAQAPPKIEIFVFDNGELTIDEGQPMHFRKFEKEVNRLLSERPCAEVVVKSAQNVQLKVLGRVLLEMTSRRCGKTDFAAR